MKPQRIPALLLGAILAFASSGHLLAAPSLEITEPPVLSAMADGPPIDPFSMHGQWFKNPTTGTEESRTHEFHDNVAGSGGGAADYGAIRGVITSITYVAGPGSDIVAFTILATISNDTPTATGAFIPGDNSHGETNPAPVSAQSTHMSDTKLVAEFAISEPGKFPFLAPPPYRDPGYMSYIIADNEEQWAWYCWNPTNEVGPGGDYYVPTWDFGDIPPGGSASKTLIFTVDPPMPPGPPPFGMPDPRYGIIVDAMASGHDIFANRTTSLKISTWIDNLYVDSGAPYYPEGEVLRGSDVSVFHNIAQPGNDWGDAPDSIAVPMYPTLAVNGGAFHDGDTNTAWLGHFWDAETNGIPSPLAVGDDFDADNDEDGITFPSALVPGSSATIGVINVTTTGSYLQGWIDFNGDKDWTDSGEQIFTNVPMPMGPTSMVFSVPAGAVGGVTFARFRLSTATGLASTGGAPDGEVEDYRVIIDDGETSYDYGDAMDPPYPTLIGSGGAGHAIVPGFLLGAMIDPEFNGQPTPAADGDDITGSDEDGVTFTSKIVAGKTNTVDVIIVSPPGGGKLDAWIDFNGDGDWFDSGEQIFTSTPLVPGLNSLTFTAPDLVNLGTNYARFRLSSGGGLAPIGMAPDGEVEDYEVTLYQPIPNPDIVITNFTLSASNTVSTAEWNAQTNITYQMQSTTNLVISNSWIDVGDYVVGPINWQTNSAAPTNQFYRITAPWTP